MYKFGKSGNQDGQFNWPRGTSLDSSNNLLVGDYNNNRVQQFSLDGRFTGKTITDYRVLVESQERQMDVFS